MSSDIMPSLVYGEYYCAKQRLNRICNGLVVSGSGTNPLQLCTLNTHVVGNIDDVISLVFMRKKCVESMNQLH